MFYCAEFYVCIFNNKWLFVAFVNFSDVTLRCFVVKQLALFVEVFFSQYDQTNFNGNLEQINITKRGNRALTIFKLKKQNVFLLLGNGLIAGQILHHLFLIYTGFQSKCGVLSKKSSVLKPIHQGKSTPRYLSELISIYVSHIRTRSCVGVKLNYSLCLP